MRNPSRERGLTLIEVLVALAMVGVIIYASLSLTESSRHLTRMNSDRQFATQKAISIMEELKAVATSNVNASGQTLAVLDNFDDGAELHPELTIQTPVLPGDKISGNVPSGGGWRYSRRISVTRLGGPTTGGVRLVRVAVFINEPTGARALADVSSVIRTLATTAPPTQVYDVYAIAVNNVPGWWVYTANLVPFVQNAINELQTRNPGLEFRVHWITKLAYGRDEEYRPYVNYDNPATTTPNDNPSTNDINWVYFYPGSLPNNATQNPPLLTEYYPTSGFTGRINIDGNNNALVVANTHFGDYDVDDQPFPHSLADQYNHAKRYPEERAIFEARRGALDAFGKNIYQDEEPTYRLLLDDMVLRPTEYTNAILINLHGELFPFPPVRNFSDPAKAPEVLLPVSLQNLRAVTHPTKVAYDQTEQIELRTYTYEAWKGAGAPANGIFPVPVTVVLKGIRMLAANIQVSRMEGGVIQGVAANNSYTDWNNAIVGAPAGAAPARMQATVAIVGNDTLITLYNSPFRSPACAEVGGAGCAAGTTNKGLKAAHRLYNMDYIPSPVDNIAGGAVPFTNSLFSDTDGPKNTARWRIRITAANLTAALTAVGLPQNTALRVETRIGAPPVGALPTTGTLYPVRNQPTNLSATYLWRGTATWLYGDGTDANLPNLPMTERYQFLGDPRHSPYADNKAAFNAAAAINSVATSRIGEGYNRYFDDFHAGGTDRAAWWPGWPTLKLTDGDATNEGWTGGGGGSIEFDVDRSFQVMRTALTTSRTVYTTMTGYSYYYVGLGGEIGYDDANQFPNSIPISAKPYTGASGTAITEQSIINEHPTGNTQGAGVKYVRRVGFGTDYWWSINWLGELFPDDVYNGANGYAARGNLPTGNLSTNFRRVIRGDIAPTTGNTLPSGTDFEGGNVASGLTARNSVRRTGPAGSTSFFWSGTAASTFHHASEADTSTAALRPDGTIVASENTGYHFPLLDPIPNNRPFAQDINNTGANPQAFLNARYGAAFPIQLEAEFYRNGTSARPGSALYASRNPATNRVAFVVVNGLSPTGASGSNFIARWSFLSLIHSFLEAGLYDDAAVCTGCPFRVSQLPRVQITNPNATTEIEDPAAVTVEWASTWSRWDGGVPLTANAAKRGYTPGYPVNFAEPTAVRYQVMYSPDNGISWKWIDDNTKALPAVKRGDKLTTATSLSWTTPAASFPDGNYVIRVEAYRDGLSLHYSYHQFTAYIRRTT